MINFEEESKAISNILSDRYENHHIDVINFINWTKKWSSINYDYFTYLSWSVLFFPANTSSACRSIHALHNFYAAVLFSSATPS